MTRGSCSLSGWQTSAAAAAADTGVQGEAANPGRVAIPATNREAETTVREVVTVGAIFRH